MKIIFLLLTVVGLSLGFAQPSIETPEVVAAQEGQGINYAPDNAGQMQPQDLLQMIYECNRATGQIIDSNGVAEFRVYGFDFIDAELYKLQGPRAFSSSTRKAETRAKGSASEYLFGVAVAVNTVLDDSEVISNAASSVGDPTGANSERVLSLSITTQNSFRNLTTTSSAGFLKGGRPSGSKIVSLGEDFGYCVVVRYDIPLDQTAPPPGFAQQPAEQAVPAQSGGESDSDDGTYKPLPPGSAGDF